MQALGTSHTVVTQNLCESPETGVTLPLQVAAEAQMCCDATEEQTELGACSSLSWTAVSCCPRESPPSSPAS